MGTVRINQMGYTPSSVKQVVYVGEAKNFQIFNILNNQLCYCGELKDQGSDEASEDRVCTGDFSFFQETGRFYIEVNGEKSLVFKISVKQHEICTDALLKAFYYQRCGMWLSAQYAGQWKHPICHLQPSYLFVQNAEKLLASNPEELEQIDTTGGWHDAGDYGRYTIAMVKTIADLLLAYENCEAAFDHCIHIPESDLPGADILHEIKYGLDFLFKMQRKLDGSVYTKVATRFFPGMIMPEVDREPLFVFDISSPATGGFAAVMAMAAGVFKQWDPAYAGRCLEAAKRAYSWLQQHPEPLLFHNPKDVISGEYGDSDDTDERYWAAAQLYKVTGNEEYHKEFIRYYEELEDRLSLGWRNVGGYGTIAYLFTEKPVDSIIHEDLGKEWLKYASLLKERSKANGYGITLALDEYKWGSLMILQNQSIHLIIANQLLKKQIYDALIYYNWDYLLGVNPMDISYVTGLGERSVMNPHHRPSAADGITEPVPGLVAGGPCSYLVDEIAEKLCKGNPPAKCYVDDELSFSTNEIDIYWNSPAVFVAAYLSLR